MGILHRQNEPTEPAAPISSEQAENQHLRRIAHHDAAMGYIENTLRIIGTAGEPSLADAMLDLRNILTGDRWRQEVGP